MIALRSAGEVRSSRLADQGKNAESTATNNNSQRAKRLNEQKPNRARREFARYQVPSIGVKSLLHDYDITYSISLYGIGLGVVLQDRVAVQAVGVYIGPYYFPSTTGLYIRVGIGSTSRAAFATYHVY